MQTWYNAFKWMSVRERKIKLLLETVTYIAISGTVTCTKVTALQKMPPV